MVKYEYRPELEVFRRVDNRGPSLRFNIVEARRVQSMMDLGLKAPTILKKMDFVNDVNMTNLRTFMNNLAEGNIDLDGDYPTPSIIMHDMDLEARVSKLERDVAEFKERMNGPGNDCNCDNSCTNDKYSFIGKVKSWMS